MHTSSYNNLWSNNATCNQRGFDLYSSSNNILSGNEARNNDYYGFYLKSSSYNTLNSNTIISSWGHGFFLDPDSHNNTLEDNKVIVPGSQNEYFPLLSVLTPLLTLSSQNSFVYLVPALFAAILAFAVLTLLIMRKEESPKQEILLEPWKTHAPRKPHCMYCGSGVPEDAKFCPLCGKVIARCSVCNLYIASGDRFVKCTHCGVLSHRDHLLEWIKIKGYCPNCKGKLRLPDFV